MYGILLPEKIYERSIIMLESVYHFDWNVFQLVEQYCWNPVLDIILKIITTLGEGGVIFILMAGVFFLFGFFKKNEQYKKIGITVIISLLFMLIVNDVVLKGLIARPRPFNFDWSQYPWAGVFNYPEIISRPKSWSFPSGHSSSAFAAAFAVCFYNRKWGIPTFIFAAVMAFSRVYVHVHYCSDILAGAVVGIIYGIAGVIISKLVYDIINEKIIMEIQARIEKK